MTRSSKGPRAGSQSIRLHDDTTQFRRLLSKNSQVAPKLRSALRKNIRFSAMRAAGAARSAVGEGQGPLRDSIAKGIVVHIMTGSRAGVTIEAKTSQMPAGKQSLVRAWESSRGWRHPVFGNDVWVTQHGRPYFRQTIFNQRDDIRRSVESAMSEAIKNL